MAFHGHMLLSYWSEAHFAFLNPPVFSNEPREPRRYRSSPAQRGRRAKAWNVSPAVGGLANWRPATNQNKYIWLFNVVYICI